MKLYFKGVVNVIAGISHITFIVKDIELATRFFVTIFEASLIYSSGDKQFSLSQEKFFMIGDVWVCIMEGDSLAERSYNHLAFKINDSDYDRYLERINSLGVVVRPNRPRVQGEGRSIYFYDFDNHLFELHTGTLQERLERYEEEIEG